VPTILITGAGSGMGRELAHRAASRGDRVIAALLPGERCGLEGNPAVSIITMDVGDDASVEAGFANAQLSESGLDCVVHCAGISPSGAVEVEPLDTLRHALNVNTVGSARVLRQALPLIRPTHGRIILFASLWGRVGGPMLSAYCASKHAIEAIVDSARRETRGQGIDIILIEPGVVRTNMVEQTVTGSRSGANSLPERYRALYGDLYQKFARMIDRESTGGVSVEEAADVIEQAMFAARPRTRYRVGKDAKAVIALASLLPDRALDGVFRKMLDRQ
jgi:NAD(P)-dependent dehydrogenase (short-subunit alcohol dehydrogenase family)